MKKIIILIISILTITSGIFAQGVGINDDNSAPDNSAMLDVKSNSKGILVPRIDFNDKPATPATGLLIYVTVNGPEGNDAFYFYNGTAWTKIAGSGGTDSDWTISENDMYSSVSGNIGIGTSTPLSDLDIRDTGDGASVWVTRTDGTSGEVTTELSSTASYGIVGTRSENALKLRVNSIDKMFVGTDGNVGVGTNTPTQKLTVAGTIESTSGGIKFPDGTTQTSAASETVGGVSSFKVHRNDVNQSIATSSTIKILWNTEEFDTNNDYDLDNNWFKPTVAGTYILNINATMGSLNTSQYLMVYIFKNGQAYSMTHIYSSGSNATIRVNLTDIVAADGVNDYFEAYVYQNSGSAKNLFGTSTQTSFSGARIH